MRVYGILLLAAGCGVDRPVPTETAASVQVFGGTVGSLCAGVVPTTFGTAPALSGTITNLGRPRLTWTAVAGASYYKVYVRYSPAGPNFEAASGNLTSTTFTDVVSVLSGSGTPRFEYQVIAYQEYYCGGYIIPSPTSNIVSFRADPNSPY